MEGTLVARTTINLLFGVPVRYKNAESKLRMSSLILVKVFERPFLNIESASSINKSVPLKSVKLKKQITRNKESAIMNHREIVKNDCKNKEQKKIKSRQ